MLVLTDNNISVKEYSWLVRFYGISTLLDYLMPNSVDTQKIKLATVVEGDPKAPFSMATTSRCSRGCYSFHWKVYTHIY